MIASRRRSRLVAFALSWIVATAMASALAEAQGGRPTVQGLRVQGDKFHVNRGSGFQAEFLVIYAYFDALKATSLEVDLDYIRDRGFHGIRVFATWQDFRQPPGSGCLAPYADNLFTRDGTLRGDNPDGTRSGPLAALFRVIAAARDRGLIVDLSFDHGTVPGLTVENYQKALTRTATLLRDQRHVIFDLQNERDLVGRSTFLTPDEVRRLRDAIKAPAVDAGRILTASTTESTGISGTVDFAEHAALDVIAFHDNRDAGWHERVTTVVEGLRRRPRSGTLRPVYLQEPRPWVLRKPMCGGAEGDADPAHFRTAVRKAKQAGAAAWTFHIQNAFIADDKPLSDKVGDDPALRALLHGASPSEPPLAASANDVP